MTGQMLFEEYTDDKLLILELKNELRLEQTRIESQKDLIQFQNVTIESFKLFLSLAMQRPQPDIIINASSKALAKAASKSHSMVQSSIDIQIKNIQNDLDALQSLLPAGSEEAQAVRDVKESLKEIEQEESPEKVKKSSAFAKLKKLIDDLGNTVSKIGKAVKT